eukprot:138503-Pelagomonas_calceolata.AAC.2
MPCVCGRVQPCEKDAALWVLKQTESCCTTKPSWRTVMSCVRQTPNAYYLGRWRSAMPRCANCVTGVM